LLWRSSYQFVNQDQPVDGPTIGPDGTIYAITRAPAPPNETEGESFLYSVRSNGALNWRWPAGRGAIHHPAIDRDGTVYLPVTNIQRADLSVVGYLHALNPDSSLLRPSLERREEQGMIEAVVLDNAGQLFAIAPLESETMLLGLRPDGSELFPPTPVPGRLSGPLGVPLPGMISAFGDRALALLADGPVLELALAVDLPAAPANGVLTYTIRARNTGVLPATNLLLLAGAPTLARYAPGSTVLDGLPVADLSEDAPVQTGVNIGLLPPGAEAVLTFRMNLQRAATGAMITNTATARCDQLGTHVSNTVVTRIN
jgi:uncharacterized repeat protein (TIGR01451 family)